MSTRLASATLVAALAGALLDCAAPVAAQSPTPAPAAGTALGSTITYQGKLKDSNGAVTGTCDLQFGLYDALVGGSQVGSTQTEENVSLSDGRFTVALDFGAVYGAARWLQIGARCPAGSGAWQTLSPRQPLTAVPAALSVPWSGITGLPAGFADGVDNDTTYTAGPGLALNGTQFSLDTGVVQARVSGSCAAGQAMRIIAADGSVTCQGASAYTAGTGLSLVNGQFSVDATAVQTRIGGTCTAGSALRVVNQDGSVTCRPDAITYRGSAPSTNSITTLDSGGDVGAMSSLTIGADGLGLIAYLDTTNLNLKVAYCSNVACSAAAITTLDSAGEAGWYPAIAIGTDGLGLISYEEDSSFDLKVAHCSDVACSTATLTTLDSAGQVGRYTSLAIGPDGFGLISYQAVDTRDLKVVHCTNTACSTFDTPVTLDSAGDVGAYTSLTIGADGRGLISYYDSTNGHLKAVHCTNTACSTFDTPLTLDSSATPVGWYSSATTGVDGLGLIGYYNAAGGDLKVVHCTNAACSTFDTPVTLDSTGDVGADTSVTIGADGLGLISYRDATNSRLKLAHCIDTACSGATIAVLDTAEAVGQAPSLAIGADGLGLISYYDATPGDLDVVHLGSTLGVPYLRRR